MPSNQILQYLKTHGEKLDAEIAAALGIPLDKTRKYLSEFSALGEVITCDTIRFDKGAFADSIVRC